MSAPVLTLYASLQDKLMNTPVDVIESIVGTNLQGTLLCYRAAFR